GQHTTVHMAGFACRIHDRSVVFATLDGARGRTARGMAQRLRSATAPEPLPIDIIRTGWDDPHGSLRPRPPDRRKRRSTAKHQRAYTCAIRDEERQSNQEHAAPNPLSQVGYTQ